MSVKDQMSLQLRSRGMSVKDQMSLQLPGRGILQRTR